MRSLISVDRFTEGKIRSHAKVLQNRSTGSRDSGVTGNFLRMSTYVVISASFAVPLPQLADLVHDYVRLTKISTFSNSNDDHVSLLDIIEKKKLRI